MEADEEAEGVCVTCCPVQDQVELADLDHVRVETGVPLRDGEEVAVTVGNTVIVMVSELRVLVLVSVRVSKTGLVWL